MIRSSSNVKLLSLVVCFTTLICLVSCKGDNGQSKNNTNKAQTDKKDNSKTLLFLAYTDSVAKLPLANFNEASLVALNKTFADKLPLAIYNPTKENDAQNILIQAYINKDNSIKAGAILLVPKSITDTLLVGDFTRYFGPVKAEKPIIGITEQPRPVQISVDPNTAIKLTFNDNKELESAHVITVEVLKYK